MRTKGNQAGQAATECIIASVFLLVPLFLIIPLVGKYIDIRHAAIGQARFLAWEYTVRTDKDATIPTCIDSTQCAGQKKCPDTMDQGQAYFFGDPTANNYGKPGSTMAINPLWRDHHGAPLFATTDIVSTICENRTPAPLGMLGDLLEDLFQFLGDVFSLVGKLLNSLGVDAQFDAIDTKGYYTSEVTVTVRSLDQILPRSSLTDSELQALGAPLVFKGKAAVQTNNWNAGSRDNATSESRGLVVTSLLAPLSTPVNKVLKAINRGLGWIPFFNIKLPALPDFGYVQDDLIPFEHLEKNDTKLKDKQGLYSYEKE